MPIDDFTWYVHERDGAHLILMSSGGIAPEVIALCSDRRRAEQIVALATKEPGQRQPFPTMGHWTEAGSGSGKGLEGWIEFLRFNDYASPEAIEWLLTTREEDR